MSKLTKESIEQQIGKSLANENGGGFGFICIWQENQKDKHDQKCAVWEWLCKEENQHGTWFIDGGWGGPPGAVHVRWNNEKQEWENGGYCGVKFKENV